MGRGAKEQYSSQPRWEGLIQRGGQLQAPLPGPRMPGIVHDPTLHEGQQQAPASPWSGFDPGLSRDQFNQQMMNRPVMTRMYDTYSGNDVYSQQRDLTDAFKAGEINSNQWLQSAQALQDTYGVETAAPNQFEYLDPAAQLSQQQGIMNQYQPFNPQGNYRDQMRGQHGGKRGGKGGG